MKKIIISLVLIMFFVSLSYASSYEDIYDSMKDDYPELVNRMLDGKVTEDDILNFLDDLSDEVEDAEDLTEENFDYIMYTAVKEVLFKDGKIGFAKDEHRNFAIMLTTEFSSEIAQALETKTLEGDLKGLNEAVKSVLLDEGSDGGAGGGGAVSEEPDEIILDEIIIDMDTLNIPVKTLSDGQVEITISQNTILKNINKELNDVSDKGGTVSDNLCGILDLRLNKDEKSYKVQLPLLTEIFNKVHNLSILTDLGGITVEKDFLAEEQSNSNLNFIISQDINVFDVQLVDESQEIKSFSKPVILSLPYELLQDQNKEYVTAVYIDDNGNEIPMGGIYNDGNIKFYTSHFSKYKVVYDLKSFTDTSEIDWAKDKIAALASKGIINGRSESSFDPNAYITRAEFTALAVRAMKLQGDKAINQFSDVSLDVWYADSVAAAYQNGVIKGRTVTTFDPNGKVTIEEALVILARIMNTKGYPKVDYSELEQTMDEDNISEWTKSEIGTALNSNLHKDIPVIDLVLNQYATRAQVASVIYEFYNKILGEN
ncbi:MAG: S-layer homology domain-containing protein [Clostridia bacterium]|nr:S-layer homology domain-containing protein [Clostridia bacterium]